MSDTEELRTLFLFEAFTETQLEILAGKGTFETLPAGPLVTEGDPAACFYVLVEGELVMSGRSGGVDIQTHRTSQRGVYCGAWNAYVADAVQRYDVSVRLTRPSRLFVMAAADFAEFMQTQFPIAVHLLGGHVLGAMRQQQLLGQRLRLMGLGSITAGLTHQLNNPAAAISRAVADLRDSVATTRQQVEDLALAPNAADALGVLRLVQEAISESGSAARQPARRSPLDIADREDAVADLFDNTGVNGGWDFASVFAESGLEVDWLEQLVSRVGHVSAPHHQAAALQRAIDWLWCFIRTSAGLNEIAEASKRISTLLAGAEQYSQMDRVDYQLVDVHELLDSTLLVCAPRGLLDSRITVRREWDRSLPAIYCYAGDLNQVWTNLIDNALDAMGGSGTLTLRTARIDSERIAVTIANNGDVIPADIIDNIFTPFFTTKTAQQNVGLGLDLVRRIVDKHCGSVTVTSEPARTEFVVSLPLQAPAPTTALSCDSSQIIPDPKPLEAKRLRDERSARRGPR